MQLESPAHPSATATPPRSSSVQAPRARLKAAPPPPLPRIQFHLVSFEGPDGYSQAGGIASRITGLATACGSEGFDTHLWFIGDPDLPGVEKRGNLTLHRWCQWISQHHRGGVYDGEERKRPDFSGSLPPQMVEHAIFPYVQSGGMAVVLAEEWQTVDSVLHLDWLLRLRGIRERVVIYWNANNVFGFDRIPWSELKKAATVTTVSRYMRTRMWGLGVDPLVIPNGLAVSALDLPDARLVAEFRDNFRHRVVLSKVARWDPDKRWLLAMDTVSELKRRGMRPLLIARGGMEAHGYEVLMQARHQGLRVAERKCAESGVRGFLDALKDLQRTDVLIVASPLDALSCRVLFRGSSAVLVNSGHEPFGLVGLEAMAVGGLACVGGTGEDYAIPGWNCLSLQSLEANEFANFYAHLRAHPAEERAIRKHGRFTARQFTWPAIIHRNLLPRFYRESIRS